MTVFFVICGAVTLLVLAVIGWFAYTRWERERKQRVFEKNLIRLRTRPAEVTPLAAHDALIAEAKSAGVYTGGVPVAEVTDVDPFSVEKRLLPPPTRMSDPFAGYRPDADQHS